jgi:hypothetical protein
MEVRGRHVAAALCKPALCTQALLTVMYCTPSCQCLACELRQPSLCAASCCPCLPQVTFHDTSKHRARVPTLTDFYGFVAAAMGPRGVAYISRAAAGKAEATAQPSMLVRGGAAADMSSVGHCLTF